MSKPTSTRVLLFHTLATVSARVFVAFLILVTITSVVSITRAGTSQVRAAAPATLNFQARLLSSTGTLVPDGTYNIEFKLYNASTSSGSSQGSCTGDANCLWTETRTGGNKVEVKNGYLSAYLGDVTGLPSNIWNQQLWLTMNIGGTGSPSWDGEMTPRIRLTSVPYAFRATVANSAETLSKNTGSFTGTVDFSTLTADRTYLFPDTSLATTGSPGTICVFNGAASNCPAASGSAFYIQNDTTVQTQTNFNIQARDSTTNGTVAGVLRGAAAGQTVDLLQFQATAGSVLAAVTAAGNLQVASSVDTRAAGALSIGTTTATSISIGAAAVTTTVNGPLTVSGVGTFSSTLGVTGLTTLSGGLTLTNGGNLAVQRNTTDITTTGTLTDLAIGTGALFRFNGASAQTLSSIASPADGRVVTIINAAATALTIQNDTGGTAANRIITGTGGNLSVPAGATTSLIYDSSASRWRVAGATATSGGGANQQLSNLSGTVAVNASLTTGADNTLDLGSSAFSWRSLYADTSVLTPSVDVAAAGALSIGTSTATSIAIGKSGVTTTITGGLSQLTGAVSLAGNAASSVTTSSGALTLTSAAAAIWSTTAGNLTIQAGSGTVTLGSSTALTATGVLSITSGGANALSVDAGGAAALNLGITNANAVSISKSGVTTTVNGALTVTQATTLNGGLTISNGGNVAIQRNTTDITTTGTLTDLAIGTGALFRFSGASAQTLSSIASPADGRIVTIINAAATALTIQNDTGGTAANRIITGTGGNISVPAGATVQLTYDSSASRWRLVGEAATSGGGANQQLSNLSGTVAVNASLTTGADNTLDLGSSAFSWRSLYADTSVLTPSVDVAAAGALSIGTSTATSIAIGKSGVTTTITGGLSQLTGAVSLAGNAASSVTTSSGALTLTSAAAAIWSTTAGNLTIQAGSGTVTLGSSTALTATGALTITSGGANALAVDAGGAAALNLGVTNANAVSISKSGVTTTVNGALTVTQAATFNGGVSVASNLTVTSAGNVAFQKGTDYSTTGATTDVNLGTGVLIRLTGASAQTINSLAGGADGRIITLVNAGTNAATLLNDDGSTGTASMRIITGTGANLSIAAGAGIQLAYDTTASRWRVVGGSATAGGGANQQLSNLSGTVAVNASLTTGADNTLDLGSSAFSWRSLYADTSVLTPTVDVAAAGALSIGTSTATSIAIGKSGITTTITGGLSQLTGAVSLAGNAASSLTTSAGALTLTSAAAAIWSTTAGNLTIQAGSGTVTLGSSTALTATGTLSITSGGATALSVDAGGAAALNLGVTNANAVSISKSGVTTTVNGALTVTQATTLNGGVTISNGGNLAVQRNTTDITTTGTLTDLAIGTGSLFRFSGASAQTLSSIASPADGRIVTIINAAATALVIQNDTGGTAANRIITGTAADLSVPAGATVTLIYDSSSTRWRVVGSSATAGGGANQQLSNLSGTIAVNASLTPNADNTLDLGSSAFSWRNLYADTSVLTPAVDTAAAGTLSLGTITANAVSISKSGTTTTVNGALTVTQATTLNAGVAATGGAVTLTGNAASSLTTSSGALTLTSAAAATWSTAAGQLTIQSGSGTVSLGTSTALTAGGALGITSGGATAMSVDAGGAAALSLGVTNASSVSISKSGVTTTVNGALTVTQATTLNGGLTLSNGGNLAVQRNTSDITTTGTLTDLAIGTGSLFRFSGASAQTLSSIASPADGRIVTIINDAATPLTIQNDTGGTAANRILTGTGGNISVPTDSTITLIYDSSDSRWRVVGEAATSGGGANQQLSNLSGTVAVNASLTTGADNTLDLGSSAFSWRTLYADTSVLSPVLDTATAGTLSVGTVTANAIAVGRSGVTTTITGGLTQLTGAVSLSGNAASSLTTSSGALTITSAAAATWSTTAGNLTLQAGSGIVSLGSSTSLTASGALTISSGGATALGVDTGGAAALNLGTTNASSVSISKSGSTTTVNGNLTVSGTLLQNNGSTLLVASSLGDFPSGGAIGTAAATVDVYTTFAITQTTASQTLTLPNPTTTTGGRLVVVNNVGSTSFSMHNVTVDSGKTQTFIWNGTAWVSVNIDRAGGGTTKIVAPSNASQALKGTADYVATGTADQTTINTALTAAAGGRVYLIEGTFNLTAAISIPNATTLSGAGYGTLITIPNAQNGTYNMIENTDQTTGYGVVIRDIRVDGNKANQTSGAMTGVYMNNMGDSPGVREGAIISGIWVGNVRVASNAGALQLVGSNYSTLLNNYVYSNNTTSTTGNGIRVNGNRNNVTNNIVHNNGGNGISMNGIAYSSVFANGIYENGAGGISMDGNSSDNSINANTFRNNGSGTTNQSIVITGSTNNNVVANKSTDSSCTSNCYAIDLTSSTVNTFLSANTYSGTTANPATINDLGVGTIYSGQADSSGNLINRSQGGGFAIGASSATSSLTVQGGITNTALSAPTLSATVINTGTTGATTRRYQITALDGTGETTGSTIQQTTTANATLSGSNYTTITWTPVGGAYQYKIYRCTGAACTPLLLATVAGNTASYDDIANGSPSGAVPSANTTGNINAAANIQLAQGGDRTLSVATTSSNAAGYGLTVSAGAAGAGASAFAGGALTLQGGAAGGTGNAAGGAVTISGGAGTGTGTQGLVNLSTTAFTSASVQTFGSSASITAGNIDLYSTLPVTASTTSVVVTVPDPAQSVIGRIVYISARSGSNDFTLRLNSARVAIDIAMKANSTATLIWNGTDWTAAGASSSTDLQSAYNNTLTSAGGAELVLNASGGAADGLTIRNNSTTPITGGLLEVQSSIGSNLLSVNNNSTEYAVNGGAETTTNFSTNWTNTTGGTVTQSNDATYFATGQYATKVVTAATANHGAKNVLSAALTSGMTYSVSFAVKGTTNFSTLQVLYSPDGTTSGTTTCATGKTVTTGTWSRILCTFTAAGTITTSNAILIRQTDAVVHTFYIDNLSVSVNANMTFAADGSVDSALGTNWTQYDADGGAGTTTVTRVTTPIYDTTGAVSDVTTAHIREGVRNNLPVTPAVDTQYLVTFYAQIAAGTFTDITVGFLPAGGSSAPVSAQLCVDYNTQTVTVGSWTKITCLVTTPSSGISDPDLVIYQPTATARTFYVDGLTMTLNSNNSNNVQIGGANKGGPTTLLTLDRASTAPIAANNDAYLGSMYYDTTTGRIQCYEADGWGACGSSPDNIITLTPEYTGAVLNGSGVGTMTADFCSSEAGVLTVGTLCANHEARNFYRWTSPQATSQTYSIYVTYKLPSTFKAWNDSNTVKLTALTDSLTNASATIQVLRKNAASTAITSCGSATTINSSANSWQQTSFGGDETACGFAGSDVVIFKIDMAAKSNANIYVENLDFVFTNN